MTKTCRTALGGLVALALSLAPRCASGQEAPPVQDAGAQDAPAQPTGAPEVRPVLERLQADGHWGEIVLAPGLVRQVRVTALGADTVAVREVIGPLQVRTAAYAVADIRSVREIGPHRIARRLAPYRPAKSVRTALALELVLPGFGYFYAGHTRQGYALLGVAALAGATAAATGKDGAAGWVPIAAWTKVGSLLHLRDEVNAANGALEDRAAEGAAGMARRAAPTPIASLTLRF